MTHTLCQRLLVVAAFLGDAFAEKTADRCAEKGVGYKIRAEQGEVPHVRVSF